MDLIARFQQVAEGVPVPQADPAARFGRAAAVLISNLRKGKRYPVTLAQRITTPYGPSIMLTLQVDPSHTVNVFLPKRFTSVFEDADFENINTSDLKYHLVFQGYHPIGHWYRLSLKH